MSDEQYRMALMDHALLVGGSDYTWRASLSEVLAEGLDRLEEHRSLESMHGSLFDAMARAYAAMMSGDSVEAMIILEEWVA